MPVGEYYLGKLIDGVAYQGRVQLEAELLMEHKGVELELVHPKARMWQSGIEFGVDYFYERLRTNAVNGALKVKITEVYGMIVNTTSIIIAFVTVKALCNALNYDVPDVSFDEKTGLFTFPK